MLLLQGIYIDATDNPYPLCEAPPTLHVLAKFMKCPKTRKKVTRRSPGASDVVSIFPLSAGKKDEQISITGNVYLGRRGGRRGGGTARMTMVVLGRPTFRLGNRKQRAKRRRRRRQRRRRPRLTFNPKTGAAAAAAATLPHRLIDFPLDCTPENFNRSPFCSSHLLSR